MWYSFTKKSFYCLIIIFLFSFITVVCPFLCNSKISQTQVSAHSCCPEKEAKQTDRKDNFDPCCDMHEQIIPVKQSIDLFSDSIQYQLLVFAMHFVGNSTIWSNTNFVIIESPPGILYGEPLYLTKGSFLI